MLNRGDDLRCNQGKAPWSPWRLLKRRLTLDDRKQADPLAPTNYYAYLLRLRRENPNEPWRVLLQDAATGERHGFASLIALLRFLWTLMENDPAAESESTPAALEAQGKKS